MLHFIEWTIFLYVVLKVCQLLFGPASRRTDAPLRARLRSGEPMLMVVIFGGSALLVLFGTRWHHRFIQGHYDRGVSCYGKLAAAKLLPGLPGKFRSFEAGEAARELREKAEDHGVQLGLSVEEIDRRLQQSTVATSASYTRLAAANSRPALAAAFNDLDRCVKGDSTPDGERPRP
jgi:hypothetical protein